MVPADGRIQKIKTTRAREIFGQLVDRVAYSRKPVLLERRGKPLAVLVPMEDWDLLKILLEEEEDRIDIRESRKALKEGVFIPYEQVRKELGLADAEPDSHRSRKKGARAAAARIAPGHRRRATAVVRRATTAGRPKDRR
jgi:prevent-host-death family protein